MPLSGVSPALQRAANLVQNGWRPNPDAFHARQVEIYHQVSIAASFTSQELFNVSPSEFTSNAASPGQWVTNEEIFIFDAITVALGLDGTAGQVVDASTGPITNAEYVREIIERCTLFLQVGTRIFVNDSPIRHFPAGGGACIDAALAVGTAVVHSVAQVHNGHPARDNRFYITPSYQVGPQTRIKGTLKMDTGIAPPLNVTLPIRVSAWGIMVTPTNR